MEDESVKQIACEESNPEKALRLFKSGYNCSQSVLAVYCERLGLDMDTALKLSSSFGGGMGRLREVCGAVSAMFMIAGLKSGYTVPVNITDKGVHYELIQELARKFKDKNGSVICRELLGLELIHDDPMPEKRTKEYYKKRPCTEIVCSTAEIIDEVLGII